jgi:LacI family transcriptional regulator
MVATIYPTLSNPIFSVSIHKLQQTLWKFGYQLLVASHEYEPEREIELLRTIVERGVDGLVLVGTAHTSEVFELARQYALPYVMTWSIDGSHHPHCIGFSYHDAAFELASLVVKHGHRRIALCNGFEGSNERARSRAAGTRAALKAAGLSKPSVRSTNAVAVASAYRRICRSPVSTTSSMRPSWCRP